MRGHLFAAGLAALLNMSAAQAAMQLQIQPIRLELPPGKTGSLTLINRGRRAAILEARIMEWRQAEDGRDDLRSTVNAILTPPIMRIAPGASQTVRVALRDASAAQSVEQAFRLVLEELPSPDDPPGVALRMRYLLPVFIGDQQAASGPVRLVVTDGGGACRIEISNAGARHVRVEKFAADLGGKTIEIEAPAYVLANTAFALPCPVEEGKRQKFRQVRLETDAGVFESAGGVDRASRP